MALVLDELSDRKMLYNDTYAPFFVVSYALHMFNLINHERKIYWESKRIPNMRLHLLFVAPPGGMKTYSMQMLGGEGSGIFSNCAYQIITRQNMNEAAMVGSISFQNGESRTREGEAQVHARDIIMIDEFSGITSSLKSSFNSQMDTQLLAALDHGHVVKSQAGGNIEYDTMFTLWAGVQPAKYDMSSGMGRRLCFLLNIPNEQMKFAIRRAIWDSKNIAPNEATDNALNEIINSWAHSFSVIESITYDYSIFELYEELDLETYEMACYDRIILGYHLATYGASQHIVLMAEDGLLKSMIRSQVEWRTLIGEGPDLIQIKKIIEDHGKTDPVSGKKQMNRCDINTFASKYQLSVSQINDKVNEMKSYGMLTINRGMVTLA